MTNVFHGLTKEQAEIVFSPEGPALIVAGPGSGKTRVLTARIMYIMFLPAIKQDKELLGEFMSCTLEEKTEILYNLTQGGGRTSPDNIVSRYSS